jgi:hypothetical protein
VLTVSPISQRLVGKLCATQGTGSIAFGLVKIWIYEKFLRYKSKDRFVCQLSIAIPSVKNDNMKVL